MKLFVFAPLLALAAGAAAKCLCKEDAETIVDRFIGILNHEGSDLGDANATAQALLGNSFTETSDSVLALQKLPLGGLSASSKQEFIAGVIGHAPPDRNITTVDIIHNCNKIVWYWIFNDIGSGLYEVKGFNLFHIDVDEHPVQQIDALYLEFNSIAWGLDDGELGCNTTAKAK